VDVREGHERGQLRQEFKRREAHARGAIGPWRGEGVHESAVGLFLEARQRHGPACGLAEELCQRITPMRRHRRMGVQGKPVDTGAARPREPWRLACIATARADAAHVLSSACAPREAVLDRRRAGAGALRGGVAPGILPGGDGGLHGRLPQAQPPARADDAPADLLEHGGHGGGGRGLPREHAGWATLVRTIQPSPLQAAHVRGPMELAGTPKALATRDRTRMGRGPLVPALDRLVAVILPARGAHDRRDGGGQIR
jgi:hypothetical protein